VLSGVASTAEILKTEIFGPIAPIVSFDGEQETIANDTQYDLASYAYTKDLSRVMRLVDSLEAGMTGRNTGLAERVALKASKSFKRQSTCCSRQAERKFSSPALEVAAKDSGNGAFYQGNRKHDSLDSA